MRLIVVVLCVILGAFAIGNLIGWLLTESSKSPFNWRIFLGPRVYYNWRNRTNF